MSGQMIDRVARALWEDRYPEPWEDAWEIDVLSFKGHVRAVIEALLEPTEHMIDAVRALDYDLEPTEIWNAMITAALKEE